MKVWGMVMIIVSCTAMGFQAGRDLRKRWQSLEELGRMMILLKNEIEYSGTPLPEACAVLAIRMEGAFAKFLLRTEEEFRRQDGRMPEEILMGTGMQLVKETGLEKKDLKILAGVVGKIGYQDRAMQLQTMAGYLKQIEYESQSAREMLRKNETMYRFLGLMGGLFFAVLLY